MLAPSINRADDMPRIKHVHRSAERRRLLAKMKTNRYASTLVILVTLALGILIGTVVATGVKGKTVDSSDASPLQINNINPQALSNAFTQVAKQIEPTVVNINTESTVKNPHRRFRRGTPPGDDNQDNKDRGQGGEDNPFQDFFDRFFGGQNPNAPPEGMRQRSLGSGVIVDPHGYIVTNFHVVEKADRIRVNLMGDPPSVSYNAKVIGTDRETDLAVLKIDVGHSLPAAKFGNSQQSQVGEWVLAVGSPFGLNQTVTAGIISAIGRNNIVPQRQFQSFIQTDAAINPGNSGGPLVNMAGQVIGINTAIYTESSGYQGVGFAMPSDTVVKVYKDLIGPEHKVVRGSIGVMFNAMPDPAVARVYGVNGGVTISDVRTQRPGSSSRSEVRGHHHRRRRPAGEDGRRPGERHLEPQTRFQGAADHRPRRQEAGFDGNHRRSREAVRTAARTGGRPG